jgi:hypothetical protein
MKKIERRSGKDRRKVVDPNTSELKVSVRSAKSLAARKIGWIDHGRKARSHFNPILVLLIRLSRS